MSNIQHPIQLERVIFTRSIVIAIPDHQPGDPAQKILGPENIINLVPVDGQEGKYEVGMSTKYNLNADAAYPYSIDMECVGLFSVDIKLSKEEAMRGVMITAHSVLYGAIREAVAWITGRQPFGQLMLGLSVIQTSQPETPKE